MLKFSTVTRAIDKKYFFAFQKLKLKLKALISEV